MGVISNVITDMPMKVMHRPKDRNTVGGVRLVIWRVVYLGLHDQNILPDILEEVHTVPSGG